MPAVLVHGVPDTSALWSPLRAHLHRDDVVALNLPGFGAPVPDGFDATKEAYADWVTEQLETVGEPVDLVGHDWGSILVQRVASVRPDLIRTLACGSGPLDKEYIWHPMAQLWQTPEAGEQMIDGWVAMPEADRAAAMAAGGSAPELAAIQSAVITPEMGRCVLALYRSAVDVGAEWEDAVSTMPRRPSLVLWGRDDPYCGPEVADRLAARLDAELLLFDDCAHWWPWDRPAESAAALERLWDRG
jgi:pimeloyl-ACP methyl ester carboxylesterase